MRKIQQVVLTVLTAAMFLSLAGCESNAATGSLIGAGAGAAGGYMIGNEMDKPNHRR